MSHARRRRAAHRRLALGVVDKIGELERRAEQLAGPPQNGFEPRHQLLQRERLRQIIVRAAAQAIDPILQPVARCQHQDRQRVAPAAQLRQHRQAIAVGQTEIEDHGSITDAAQRIARFGDAVDDVGLIARRHQPAGEQSRELDIVLDDQKAHRSIPVFTKARLFAHPIAIGQPFPKYRNRPLRGHQHRANAAHVRRPPQTRETGYVFSMGGPARAYKK
jgi:hypothetical protein